MDGFDQDFVVTVILVVLTVVALGSVAATINDVTGADTNSTQVTIEPRGNAGDDIVQNKSPVNGSGADINQSGQEGLNLSICIEALQTPASMFGIIAAVGLLLYGLYRRYNAATSLLVGTGVVPMAWGSYFFMTNCATGDGGGGTLFGDSTAIVTNNGTLEPVSVPPLVIVGVFALLMVVGVVAVLSATSEDEAFEPVEEEIDEPDAADFAAAARRAADRIEEENVPVDNAVYRAWLEMTSLLDIDKPDTTTPRDFGAMVIDAGLDRDDVTELTELFNEVRYGGKSADTREDRAIEILRNIEETYQRSVESESADADVEAESDEANRGGE